MGIDESHFNVSLTARDKITNNTVSTDHTALEEKGERQTEEKGEPKRIRTEVPLLTSSRYIASESALHLCLSLSRAGES